jgi:predicted dehydrogenase
VPQPVRLGIVGVGTLAQRLLMHLTLPDVAEAAVVTHLCDPVEGRAAEAAEAFGVPRWSTDLASLLSDDEVDAVSICSPIGLHYEQGLAAIRAGKHVHFNKTMTVSCDQATEIIEEAKVQGVRIVASPGEVLRAHHVEVKRLIAEGAIGKVCWAACGAAFGTYHLDEKERRGTSVAKAIDPSWYFRLPGGGPLYDITAYALHGLTGILGSAKRVTAMSGVRIPERQFGSTAIRTEADDNTLILLDFGDGLFAFAYGAAAGILSDEVWDVTGRYYGTTGSIVGFTLNGVPFDYEGRELASGAPDGEKWLLPHVGPAHRTLLEQHVYEDVMQLVDWVRIGVPSKVTAEHARHVIEIIECAYAAAKTGQTQSLRTTITGLSSIT